MDDQQKPRRILRVCRTLDPLSGGPIEGALQVSQVLTEWGHSTHFATLDAPGAPWLQTTPFQSFALGAPQQSWGSYGYSAALVPWLEQHSNTYDAIFVDGLWQYHGRATHQACRKTGAPYWVYPHGMLDPWFKRAHQFKHLKKSMYWLGIESRVLSGARAVCFTCEEERLLARESFRPYKIREQVVSFGTRTPPGDPEIQRAIFFKDFPELADKRILLFLSRIHPKKGCDLLVEAFAAVASQDPALHLVMAGPDQEGWKAELEAQAQKLGIADRITWPGMLRDDKKWGAYHSAELFVLSSHQENFGIVVAEALACGLPVLISNKVNIWREIQIDGAGLVTDDTAESTLQGLREWLSLPTSQREAMRGKASDCFRNRFEIHQAAQSVLQMLDQTC